MPKKVMIFDLRHPPQFRPSGAEIYAAAMDMIEWADGLGFARIGLGEHHQSPDGYIPCPLVCAAAIGGRTRSVRVRISVILAPLYDPIRLAEEVAVADLCLQGRLDIGLAAGYVEEDFALFGADYHRRGTTMEELIPLLRQAWTGEPFEHRGTTVRVTPRPVQDPMPIHLGGSVRRAIERAARLADGYFPPGMPAPWEAYRRVCAELGQPDPGAWPRRGPIFLWVTTDDKDKVWERLAPHIRHQIESYAGWTEKAWGHADGPFVPSRDISSLSQGGAYQVLDPEEAIALANDLGPSGELHLNPLLAGIEPAEAWRMLRLVQERVLPHVAH